MRHTFALQEQVMLMTPVKFYYLTTLLEQHSWNIHYLGRENIGVTMVLSNYDITFYQGCISKEYYVLT